MNYNLPKLKLFLLQKRYSEICKLIVLIQDHLNMLVKINYLGVGPKECHNLLTGRDIIQANTQP